jgi:hypothetical protein
MDGGLQLADFDIGLVLGRGGYGKSLWMRGYWAQRVDSSLPQARSTSRGRSGAGSCALKLVQVSKATAARHRQRFVNAI